MKLSWICIGCGKKEKYFSKQLFPDYRFFTNESHLVCLDCAKKVFPESNIHRSRGDKKVSNWISHHNDVEFLHYLKKGTVLQTGDKWEVYGEELFCPFCGSEDVTPLSKHREGFSAGKAVAGAVLAGGVGALAGFAGESSSKVDWLCNECHKAFVK